MKPFQVNLIDSNKAFSRYDVEVNNSIMMMAKREYDYAAITFLKNFKRVTNCDPHDFGLGFSARYFSKFKDKFTKTDGTRRVYTNRSKSLFRRFFRKTGKDCLHNQEEFFMWLMVKKQLFATNTWKADKFALIYIAKKLKLGHLLGLLLNTNNRGGKDFGRKVPACEKLTSAQKEKGVRKEDFKKIAEKYFVHGDGYWVRVGFEMFITILSTGLRPIELTQSYITTTKDAYGKYNLALKVKNAKHTNGRGNGEYRTIFINQYNTEIQDIIINAIEGAKLCLQASGKGTSPQRYVSQASKAFSRVMKKIFPRRLRKITLYSARHQFAADAKKSGLSPAEVAALMGHASDATAFRHYARVTRGRASSRISKPLPSEVDTVNRCYKPISRNKNMSAKNTVSSKQNTGLSPTHSK